MDSFQLESLQLFAETDVSERGYIHGGTVEYSVTPFHQHSVQIHTGIYNELSTEINIPGVLLAEKDNQGTIWQCSLLLHSSSLRSGLNSSFIHTFQKIQTTAQRMAEIPITLFINGQPRASAPLLADGVANANYGIAVLPHCFINQEIYLQ